jgi:hypothetical protein
MAVRLLGGPATHFRTTDHSTEIEHLRNDALLFSARYGATSAQAVISAAAADLLECHDATGISLDNWKGPRALVEYALSGDNLTFLENGI